MKTNHLSVRFLSLLMLIVIISTFAFCSGQKQAQPFPPEKNPWQTIRKTRIRDLLPQAMKSAGVDAWIVICRENDNDPLAIHVGGENASGTAAFLFFLEGERVRSVAVSPGGEATALKDIKLHDEVVIPEGNSSVWETVFMQLEKADPDVIAINSSRNSVADGLSYTQRNSLEKALGRKYAKRMVSSTDLVMEWLSVKLPEEIEIMKQAAAITAQLEIEAYRTVIPGKTTDADVARFLKKRMSELGVTDAWSPAQNPNVNSGPDRGHSHSTDKVIMPGDVIQTDFGIKVFDIWCSDIQRFAYVLQPGEKAPPEDIERYFLSAVKGHRKVRDTLKPGITGWDADKVQRDWMKEAGSLPVRWGTGHPVGYWAHDCGPALSGAARRDAPYGSNARILRPGQTFAYDGFFKWIREDGTPKTISVEEMAFITEDGAEYMCTPQESLVLIPSK